MTRKRKKSRPTKGRKRGIVLAALSSVAVATVAVAAVMLSEPAISPEQADVTVYKRANCGCCSKWVDHLRDHGLVVRVQNVRSTRDIQTALGVPDEMRACHTATVSDRWVEGHVPADLIYALIQDDPADVRGLAVPGMPIGSPGMEGPNPQAYEIMRISPTGEVDVMAQREGALHRRGRVEPTAPVVIRTGLDVNKKAWARERTR